MQKFTLRHIVFLLSSLVIGASASAQTVPCPGQTAPAGGFVSRGSENPNDPLGQCRLVSSRDATITGVGASGAPGDAVYGAGATAATAPALTAGTGSTLLGTMTQSTGIGATVSGFASVGAQMGTANGLAANAGMLGVATGTYSGTGGAVGGVAVGSLGIVAADYGSGLGYNVFVSSKAQGSVALGSNSVADTAGVVSFGNSNLTRRLTNITDGIALTDAASMGQLTVVSNVANHANLNAYNAGALATNAWFRASDAYNIAAAAQNDVNQLRTDVVANRHVAAQGVASALALQTSTGDVPVGKTAVSLGAGNYDGASAVGLSVAHTAAFDFGQKDNQGNSVHTPVMFSAGVATGSNRAAASRVSASFIF